MKKLCIAVAALICLGTHAAQAQVGGLHILGTGELQTPAAPQVNPSLPSASAIAPPPPTPAISGFVLNQVVIDGASSLPPATLQSAWAPAIGHRINSADLDLIMRRIGAVEGNAGIALYSVSLPHQTIRNGIVHILVTEISVVHVVIAVETAHEKLGLMQAYATNIMRSRPLTRRVLERNILLMGDIAGTKVGSQFVPIPGHPDDVQLVLVVQKQKIFGGFSINNQGTPLLDNTQAVFNAGVNNLFHEGERTQLVLGLPVDIRRYQYYGINDIEPIGDDGLTLSLSAGELVSNPIDHGSSGNAELFGAQLSYPIIRAVHTNIGVSGGLDAINSDNAFLDTTTSDERTRALRLAFTYNDDKYFEGIDNAGASISEGLNIFGARQAAFYYGKPSFTKGDLNLERLQLLPHGFALRLSATGQFTDDRLPPSEEFDYGGPEYGEAFTAAELSGDEGIAGLAQLAHPVPLAFLPKQLAGTSVFVLTDYGRIWNRDFPFEPTDRAASFAAGVKLLFVGKFALELGAATPIIKPEFVPHDQHWRFILETSGHF